MQYFLKCLQVLLIMRIGLISLPTSTSGQHCVEFEWAHSALARASTLARVSNTESTLSLSTSLSYPLTGRGRCAHLMKAHSQLHVRRYLAHLCHLCHMQLRVHYHTGYTEPWCAVVSLNLVLAGAASNSPKLHFAHAHTFEGESHQYRVCVVWHVGRQCFSLVPGENRQLCVCKVFVDEPDLTAVMPDRYQALHALTKWSTGMSRWEVDVCAHLVCTQHLFRQAASACHVPI